MLLQANRLLFNRNKKVVHISKAGSGLKNTFQERQVFGKPSIAAAENNAPGTARIPATETH